MDYHSVCDLFFLNINPVMLAATTQAGLLLGIIIVVLLVICFFISGAEIAFFSLTNKDINLLKTKQDKGWRRIANLLEEPRNLLASLMVANILVKIAIIIVSNVLIDEVLILEDNLRWLKFLVKVVLISFIIILFGEILPKVRANQNNLRFAYESSYLVEILNYVFGKLGDFLIMVSEKVEKSFGAKDSKSESREKIDRAIKSTVTEVDEQKILAGIYKFGDITVKQVMRIRLDVSGVDVSLNFEQLKQKMGELQYSRLPVYKENLDNIVGIIHTKDIIAYLNEPADFEWQQLLRPPYFVLETKQIQDLLTEFQTKRIHFAVVVDEFGGTSGIVTLEDIIEEIVGDIRDEFDTEDNKNRKIDNETYIFEGKTMINDVCRQMELPEDTFDVVRGESDSLGGLILEIAGKIPAVNEVITSGDFEFEILEVEKTRIQTVKVRIKNR